MFLREHYSVSFFCFFFVLLTALLLVTIIIAFSFLSLTFTFQFRTQFKFVAFHSPIFSTLWLGPLVVWFTFSCFQSFTNKQCACVLTFRKLEQAIECVCVCNTSHDFRNRKEKETSFSFCWFLCGNNSLHTQSLNVYNII